MNVLDLKLSYRSFKANKMYVLISILGLAIGFSTCFLITLFVKHELSYDSHFSNVEEIFRVIGTTTQNGSQTEIAQTTFMLKPTVENLFPDIILATRVSFESGVITKGSQPFSEPNLIFADPSFFNIFKFQFSQGNAESFETDIRSIVLTESGEEKYFGNESSIGKTLEYEGISFIVSAVIQDIPENTHFGGQVILPIKGIEHLYPEWMTTNAGGTSHYTYFLVSPDTNPNLLARNISEHMISTYQNYIQSDAFFSLQNITEIHLGPNLVAEIKPSGQIMYIFVFITIGVIVFTLACINFINLSMAASFNRAKEISIKKVLGATQNSQIFQFQWESILITFVSGVLALVLTQIIIPYINIVLDKNLSISLTNDLDILIGLLVAALFVGFLSGRVPALFLFRMKTADVLRGSSLAISNTKIPVSSALIFLQFLIASTLISSSMIIMNQINFLQNKDLGIDTENVILIPIQNSEVQRNFEYIRNELLNTPGIQAVSASSDSVTGRVRGRRPYTIEGEESITLATVIVGNEYFETLGSQFKSGRSFSKDIATDINEAYILNDSAINFLGLNDPIGTNIRGRSFTGSTWSVKEARIIGVVNDFNMESLHSEVTPVVFSLASEKTFPVSYMIVRIENNSISTAITSIGNLITSIAPIPFEYEFIQDSIDQQYGAEKQFFSIFSILSLLAIAISCLGLYAISAFMMKKKSKNIAIRKILGAAPIQLITVLSREFLFLVLIASFLSWPISFFYSNQWLQNFAYRTDINLAPFIIGTILALIVAMISMLFHAIRLIKANPIDVIQV